MSSTIRIDASGRLVLPKTIRERLNLHAGSAFRVDVVAGHIELTPGEEEQPDTLRKKGGIKVLRRRGVTADAASAVRAERDSRQERGLKQ
jgi:AbrB family looped-hinge helix DNA binding protein